MGISLREDVTLRGSPSLFQVHFSSLLEMSTQEFSEYLRRKSEDNPFLLVSEAHEASVICKEGQPIQRDKGPRSVPPQHIEYVPLPNDYSGEERQDALGICDDFSESLPVYLSVNMPSFKDKAKARLAEIIVDLIDERGFLKEDPEFLMDIAGCTEDELSAVLEAVKSVDPGGIGSRDIRDFLWWQCHRAGWESEVMRRIIYECLEEVAKGKLDRLSKKLGVSKGFLKECLRRLKSLRPYPTWGMNLNHAQYRQREGRTPTSDFVLLYTENGDCVLQIIEPNIEIDPLPSSQRREVHQGVGEASPDWLQRFRNLEKEALELMQMTGQRRQILMQVAGKIFEKQGAYLAYERDYKEPLTISQIAAELGVSISTVSRAIKNKTIAAPRGTFTLKDLLSQPFLETGKRGVSCDYVRRRIENLSNTNHGKPRSDREIAELLQAEGIYIARRTVNKYRNEMKYGACDHI